LGVKDIISRIRWKSVILVLVLIIVVVLLFKSLPFQPKVRDNVGISLSADPDTIPPGGKSTIDVEVTNLHSTDTLNMVVSVKTHDEKLVFSNNNMTIFQEVSVGPKETRKLKFNVRLLSGALEGKYSIDASAREKSSIVGVEDTIYLNVESER